MTNEQFLKAISPKTDEKEELNDWNSTRTFIRKENLLKCLEENGLSEEWFLIVRTGDDKGRWTAIFSKRHIDKYGNTSVMHVIDCGFKVI